MSEAVTQEKTSHIPTPAELGFDPEQLRKKYAAERQKRLRADGNSQYQEVAGDLGALRSGSLRQAGLHATRAPRGARGGDHRRGLWRTAGRGAAAGGGMTEIRIIEKGGRFRRHVVLEPLSGRAV